MGFSCYVWSKESKLWERRFPEFPLENEGISTNLAPTRVCRTCDAQRLSVRSCHSVRCVQREPPQSAQGTQVERREPLKCLIQSGGRIKEGELEGEKMQRKMLSPPSPPPCWCEGSCRKQMTYISIPTSSSSKASPDSEKPEWGRYGKTKKWERVRLFGVGKERETDRLPVWQDRHEKLRQTKGNRESFDGNPLRLFLPSLSSGYIKHI